MRVFPCPSLVLRTLNPNLSVMAPTLDSMRSLAGAMRTVSRSLRDVPSSPLHGLKPSDIPRRVIWGYWAQGEAEMPALQRLCVETWRRRNPGWDVRVLCRRTVWDYLGESDLPNRWREVRSHQLASDAVRLALLARYGGVYMDAAIILLSSLGELGWNEVESGSHDALAFFHPHYGGRRFVESWCVGCRRHDPVVLRWRDLLREVLHNRVACTGLLTHPLYQGLHLEDFEAMNRAFVADFDFREYLVIHVMYRRILETEPELKQRWDKRWVLNDAGESAFKLQNAIESSTGCQLGPARYANSRAPRGISYVYIDKCSAMPRSSPDCPATQKGG
eukprot:Hpha_TRINITY_DN12318_c0_g1::TRINITY_DN12318_c0_g1_i6::g.155969::m.155969